MPFSTVRDTCIFCLAIITAIFLGSQEAMAGDSPLLSRISPHISLNKNPSAQELQAFTVSKKYSVDGYMSAAGDSASPPLKKNLSGQDLLSLALGARFQISDWFGIGAACTLPLVEEDPGGAEDLTIEAMVTMQF